MGQNDYVKVTSLGGNFKMKHLVSMTLHHRCQSGFYQREGEKEGGRGRRGEREGGEERSSETLLVERLMV